MSSWAPTDEENTWFVFVAAAGVCVTWVQAITVLPVACLTHYCSAANSDHTRHKLNFDEICHDIAVIDKYRQQVVNFINLLELGKFNEIIGSCLDKFLNMHVVQMFTLTVWNIFNNMFLYVFHRHGKPVSSARSVAWCLPTHQRSTLTTTRRMLRAVSVNTSALTPGTSARFVAGSLCISPRYFKDVRV